MPDVCSRARLLLGVSPGACGVRAAHRFHGAATHATLPVAPPTATATPSLLLQRRQRRADRDCRLTAHGDSGTNLTETPETALWSPDTHTITVVYGNVPRCAPRTNVLCVLVGPTSRVFDTGGKGEILSATCAHWGGSAHSPHRRSVAPITITRADSQQSSRRIRTHGVRTPFLPESIKTPSSEPARVVEVTARRRSVRAPTPRRAWTHIVNSSRARDAAGWRSSPAAHSWYRRTPARGNQVGGDIHLALGGVSLRDATLRPLRPRFARCGPWGAAGCAKPLHGEAARPRLRGGVWRVCLQRVGRFS